MTATLSRGLYSTLSFSLNTSLHSNTIWHPSVALFSHVHSESYKSALRHSSTTTATRVIHNQRINPPTTTLPPPLVLPNRSPSQSAPSYYYSLGRAYLTFYKTGLKAVYSNFKSARALTSSLPQSTSIEQALRKGMLSRGEWQLIRRSRHDVARIPLFALVVACCGEFTPLVVVFMNGIVPKTCRVPKQVIGSRKVLEERRKASFRRGTLASEADLRKSVEELEKAEILHIGRSLGLFSKWWDKLGEYGLGGVPSGLLKARVRKGINYLDMDDFAIERDGSVSDLEIEELRIALEDRGIDVLGKDNAQLKVLLRNWLKARGKKTLTSLLLTRPSAWT